MFPPVSSQSPTANPRARYRIIGALICQYCNKTPPPIASNGAKINHLFITLRQFWRCRCRVETLAHTTASPDFCLRALQPKTLCVCTRTMLVKKSLFFRHTPSFTLPVVQSSYYTPNVPPPPILTTIPRCGAPASQGLSSHQGEKAPSSKCVAKK